MFRHPVCQFEDFAEINRLTRWASMDHSLKAMVPVTQGLSLRGPGEDSETTLTAVKTRLFYKYYAHLSKPTWTGILRDLSHSGVSFECDETIRSSTSEEWVGSSIFER
jgi:hypothetical protein